jgi:hypothetical protein
MKMVFLQCHFCFRSSKSHQQSCKNPFFTRKLALRRMFKWIKSSLGSMIVGAPGFEPGTSWNLYYIVCRIAFLFYLSGE